MSRRSLAGLRKNKRHSPLAECNELQPKRDFKLVKSRISKNSLSDDWEEARREWEFEKIIFEDDLDVVEYFTQTCELCNHVGLKRNYEIFNPGTGKYFLVGSTCIKRFLLLKGAENQSQSAEIFDFQVKKMLAARKLQSILPSLLSEPTQYEAHVFRNASKNILESLDSNLITAEKWKHYLKLLLGPNPNENHVERIRIVLFNPSKMHYKKVTDFSTGEEDGRWANRTRVKKTKIETTSARSKEDRPGSKF